MPPLGFDVLIQMKNIVRVETFFGLHQSVIIRSVSCGDAVAFLLGHKVHISAGRRIRRAGFEKVSRPANALLVILRVIPSPVHVEHELRVPVTIRHRSRRDTIGGAGNQPDENLALRGGQLPGVLDDGIQCAIGELRKIVGLPVVSGSRCEQRIKSLLPLDVRLWTDVLPDGITEGSQRRDQFLRVRYGTGVEDRQHDDFLAVDVFRGEKARAEPCATRPRH